MKNCWFSHAWAPWKDIGRIHIQEADDVRAAKDLGCEAIGRTKIEQERRCARCNIVQLRTVRS
jgi:hypothetical protein